jgi:hypothetical protein
MKTALTAAVLLVLAAGAAFGAEAQPPRDRAYLVLTDGTPHVGDLLTLDAATVRLQGEDGKVTEIERDRVAFINFHPGWIVARAYGVKDNVYYDFATGVALTLPTSGWLAGYDSEGHLFLTSQEAKLALGLYPYVSRFASLEEFLTVHGNWRKAKGMPEQSYTDGAPIEVGGQPGMAFRYQSGGSRILDMKTIGPSGQGLVVALIATGLTDEQFEEARKSIAPLLAGIRFAKPLP